MLRRFRGYVVWFSDVYGIGFVLYFSVGIVSALVEWSTFIACLCLVAPLWAASVGFIIATGVNLILSHYLVFRPKRALGEEIFLTFALSALAFVVNILVFNVLFEFIQLQILLAKMLGTCSGFVFNYAFRQFFIFSRESRFVPVSALDLVHTMLRLYRNSRRAGKIDRSGPG